MALAATALVAQTSTVVVPQLAGVLTPHIAAQLKLRFHGFSASQLAYAPVPWPALLSGASAYQIPDPLLCAAHYVGGEVEQLVFAVPQGAIVLADASSSLSFHVLAVPALTWTSLAGICIDSEHEQVVLLDAAGPNLLRIDLADLRAGQARFQSTSLPPDWSTVRGIAFDFARDRILGFVPATGNLLQHSAVDPEIRAGLLRPVPEVLAFGFAPIGTGARDLFVSSGDQRMLTAQWTWSPVGHNLVTATLRAVVQTGSWSPSSPDPSAVVYDPLYDRLIISDGEVDEMPIYAEANVFETSRTGVLARTTTTQDYSNEPSGMTLDTVTRTFYFSDDDRDKIFVVTTGPDGLLNTADDSVRSFSVRNFCDDAEDVALDSSSGELWIIGGDSALVHKLRPGLNGIFDGTPPNGDDVLVSYDLAPFGATDCEGIAIHPTEGGIYVVGQPKTLLLHINPFGQLLRSITLPATGLLKPAGITFAPSTVGTGVSLFLVDRGFDNNYDRRENDGLLLEYGLPPWTPGNQPPLVNAGPDVSTVVTAAVHLAGVVEDDGLPGGPLVIHWSLLSGPGTATFTAPTQAVTDASFSAIGTYTCVLSAYDGQYTTTDTVVVTVLVTPPPGSLDRAVAHGHDDAEEEAATGAVNRSSSDLELVVDGGLTQVVGIRFQNVTIPAFATITSAYIQFTVDEAWSIPTQLTIAGQASDNPATFSTTNYNVSSRPRTTATVAWAPVPWTIINQSGPDQRTPDLTNIVQEIKSRPGWISGNAMVFVITGTGRRTAVSFDGSSVAAARLIVSYQ
jgi:hypothetical protein